MIKRASALSIGQFFKYMAGGNLYFWSGYGVFALGFSVLHWSWWGAKIAADLVGWTLQLYCPALLGFCRP